MRTFTVPEKKTPKVVSGKMERCLRNIRDDMPNMNYKTNLRGKPRIVVTGAYMRPFIHADFRQPRLCSPASYFPCLDVIILLLAVGLSVYLDQGDCPL